MEWTIGKLINWTTEYFTSKGIENPRLDAEVLLAHSLGIPRIQLYVRFDQPLQEHERGVFRESVKRRAAREPVAYIIGKKEFFSMEFHVSPAVIIPRPETELLVELAIKDLTHQFSASHSFTFLDIGTGSGAIVVSVAKALPVGRFYAFDNSSEALAIANKNITQLGESAQITLIQHDLMADSLPFEGQKFDMIVSNPPYIRSADIPQLQREVKDYEPRNAIDGGSDGLRFYRKIIPLACEAIGHIGILLLEIGFDQAEQIERLCGKYSRCKSVEIFNDLENRPRVARVLIN